MFYNNLYYSFGKTRLEAIFCESMEIDKQLNALTNFNIIKFGNAIISYYISIVEKHTKERWVLTIANAHLSVYLTFIVFYPTYSLERKGTSLIKSSSISHPLLPIRFTYLSR